MHLTHVLAREVRYDGAEADTLLHAQDLYLEFSLWDLFKGNYTVQGIHGKTVKLYPGLDSEGRENYIIWKTDTTSTASSPLELEAVSFDGLATPLPRRNGPASSMHSFSKAPGAQRPFQRCSEHHRAQGRPRPARLATGRPHHSAGPARPSCVSAFSTAARTEVCISPKAN